MLVASLATTVVFNLIDLVVFYHRTSWVTTIALIVPLMMPALALRGGLLMPTWASLAASEFAWLLYDIWLALKPAMLVPPRIETMFEEIFRIVAILFACSAAIAQRRAARA